MTMILQRLNMDTSWWTELSSTRILVDPWLEGAEVDYAQWFNMQWHRTEPMPYSSLPAYDAVLITQKYADHCHEATLRRLQPEVILAPKSLESRLRRWLPGVHLQLFGSDSREYRVGTLTVTQLPTRRRRDPIYDAFVLSDGTERLMIANHGFTLDEGHLAQLAPSGGCDVLLSPFNRYRLPAVLGGVVTPGLEGLRRLVEQLRPRCVIQTHDEDKHARGLIPRLATIDIFEREDMLDRAWLRDRIREVNDYERCQP